MAERFRARDVDHRHVIGEAGVQLVIVVDVDFEQVDAQPVQRLGGANRRLRLVAEMAAFACIERDFDATAHRLDSTANVDRPQRKSHPRDRCLARHWRRGVKIINIASRAAYRGETEFADYGASKAALVNLTISIARGCAKDNITSTCVAPGFIETEMAKSELEKHYDEIVNQVPLRRVGTVDDVAGVILFLASSLADYLNGTTIDVNGGSWLHIHSITFVPRP